MHFVSLTVRDKTLLHVRSILFSDLGPLRCAKLSSELSAKRKQLAGGSFLNETDGVEEDLIYEDCGEHPSTSPPVHPSTQKVHDFLAI